VQHRARSNLHRARDRAGERFPEGNGGWFTGTRRRKSNEWTADCKSAANSANRIVRTRIRARETRRRLPDLQIDYWWRLVLSDADAGRAELVRCRSPSRKTSHRVSWMFLRKVSRDAVSTVTLQTRKVRMRQRIFCIKGKPVSGKLCQDREILNGERGLCGIPARKTLSRFVTWNHGSIICTSYKFLTISYMDTNIAENMQFYLHINLTWNSHFVFYYHVRLYVRYILILGTYRVTIYSSSRSYESLVIYIKIFWYPPRPFDASHFDSLGPRSEIPSFPTDQVPTI